MEQASKSRDGVCGFVKQAGLPISPVGDYPNGRPRILRVEKRGEVIDEKKKTPSASVRFSTRECGTPEKKSSKQRETEKDTLMISTRKGWSCSGDVCKCTQ